MNKDKLNKVITFLKSADNRRDILSDSELLSLKNKVLVAIAKPQPAAKHNFSWRYSRQKIVRYAVSFLLGFSLVGGTAFASTSAKPGDLLYPVKLATEKAKLGFTFSESAKVNLQAEFAGERLKELRQLDAVFAATSSKPSVKDNPGKDDDKKEVNVRVQARAEAETEVKQAIEALKQVQEKQQAKGNSKAAAELLQNIIKLQTDAKSQNLKIWGKEDSEDDQQKNNFWPATTTIRSRLNLDSGSKIIRKREVIRPPVRFEREDGEDENDDDDNKSNSQPVVTAPATSTPATTTAASYTLAQVALAKTSAKCWTAINGKVYNLTSWISKHPGGESAILQLCGKDGTSLFMAQHGGQTKPESVLSGYFIGTLK
ncbi:MAG: cytochrome b5 domain-containing protein [Candidatus Doudnabacteria bacterium]|nr:cytochrome b5 domain-containing protein [Candidatus Doudnabacteria bacterium]